MFKNNKKSSAESTNFGHEHFFEVFRQKMMIRDQTATADKNAPEEDPLVRQYLFEVRSLINIRALLAALTKQYSRSLANLPTQQQSEMTLLDNFMF